MVGTLWQAGAGILRRAAALGLSGLAVAVFIGVMAFAFTTSPAGQPQESLSRYLSASSRLVELRSLAAGCADSAGTPSVTVVPVNQQALQASRVEEAPVDAGLLRALEERAAAAEAGPTRQAEALVTASRLASPEPAPATPPLAPGDRVEATVSFYYCERGSEGLHPGDGGGFCGAIRDGSVVYPGAAACDYAYLGQRFRIVGDPLDRIYVCADTGSAVHGLHRDIWFMTSDEGWMWQQRVGQVATIEILP